MRKDKMQQKNQGDKQLKLFASIGESYDKPGVGDTWTNDKGAELSSRLEQQRTLTENILENTSNNTENAITNYKINFPVFDSD